MWRCDSNRFLDQGVSFWRVHLCGRTPTSARVHLDPLLAARGVLLGRERADEGVGRGPGVRPTARAQAYFSNISVSTRPIDPLGVSTSRIVESVGAMSFTATVPS